MTTAYALLLDRCGLSLREASAFHGVRPDTVAAWSSGRRNAPAGAIDELRNLYARIERAGYELAKLIDDLISEHGMPGAPIEMGLASDDHEAQSMDPPWPCVGAQAAALGIAAALINVPMRIVPRGATPASALAADVRQPT